MKWLQAILTIGAIALIAQPPVNAPTGLTITIDGQVAGTFTSLVFTSGNGVVWSYTPNGSVLDLSAGQNTATVLTRGMLQTGTCQFIDSSNGTSAYTYSFGSAGCTALTAYKRGMSFILSVDAANTNGACTLNIDKIGIVAIKQNDGGSNDPAPGIIKPGQFYHITYDGKVFRLI